MTTQRRRRRQRRSLRPVVLAVLVLLVFAIGIALGEALNDNPRPGNSITQSRTFTLRPGSGTVTVTAP